VSNFVTHLYYLIIDRSSGRNRSTNRRLPGRKRIFESGPVARIVARETVLQRGTNASLVHARADEHEFLPTVAPGVVPLALQILAELLVVRPV
jgi:hypothetical protein